LKIITGANIRSAAFTGQDERKRKELTNEIHG